MKRRKLGKLKNPKAVLKFTREQIIQEFCRFLLTGSNEQRESILGLLLDGSKGLNNMSNKELAQEFSNWSLDLDLDGGEIVIEGDKEEVTPDCMLYIRE